MITIGSVVIRVDDLDRQRAFWCAALDYQARPEDDDTFALLRPRTGDGPNVSLDTMPSRVHLPPRIHLDLYADDQAGEVGRLIALGATEVVWDRRPEDADFVILADPEGNRFCVIDAGRDDETGAVVVSAEQEVLALEDALFAAWGRPTTPDIADLLDDDLSFWSLAGERWDKAAFLRLMASASRDGETCVDAAQVRIVGDTAVYTARVTDVPGVGDAGQELRTCVTDVFSRAAGRWRLVASHESVLAPAEVAPD